MLNSVIVSTALTLPTLRKQYCRHALTVRNIAESTTDAQLVYIDRLFRYFWDADSSDELFAKIAPATLCSFFVDYAKRHGPGSRRSMHNAARCFLRFAYEEQFIANDLSALVPAVRHYKMNGLPKALPEASILALEQSIERSGPVGLRDTVIICLLSTYGVRGVQVRRLRLEDIDWQNERIHFPAAKGGRAIEQHLTSRAGNRLSDYIVNGRPESPLPQVFLMATTGAVLSKPAHLSGMIRRRLLRAKIPVPDGVSRAERTACAMHLLYV